MKFKVWCYDRKEWESDFIAIVQNGILIEIREGTWRPISPKNHKVVWSTGLKDKNGKEIYEGDRIESRSPYINIGTEEPTGRICVETFQIIYLEGEARYATKNISSKYNKGRVSVFSMDQDSIKKYWKVIGNIYENPELLKGK